MSSYKRAYPAALRVGAAVASAYKSYKSAKRTRRTVVKRVRRKTRRPTSTRTYRRRRVIRQNHAIEQRSIGLYKSARRPTAMKLAMSMMEPQWYRVQGLSQFDTTSGFIPIANRTNTAGERWLPVHFWDVTSQPNLVNSVHTFPNSGFGLNLASAAADSAVTLQTLNTQDASGGTLLGDSRWQIENISANDGTEISPKRKCFHDYTHVKLNLYGVRNRSTRYLVELVMVTNELADFEWAAGTNIEKKKLVDYLARPFIYNNLNAGDMQSKAHIKILRTFDTTIAPITTDEVGGANAVPHMQTVNWFIRHNRTRRYDWARGPTPSTFSDAAFDQETAGPVLSTRVKPNQRVYLLIRAMSPSQRNIAGATWQSTAPDPATEPSYDFMIRNKFTIPT